MSRHLIAGFLIAALTHSLNAHACATNDHIPLAAARFSPRLDGDKVTWDARYIVEVDTAFDFKGGRITLATPLPNPQGIQGLEPIIENNQVTALCVPAAALHDRTIAVSIQGQSIPVALGSTVQIIDTSVKGKDTHVEFGGARLDRYLGYLAPRSVGHDAREEARRLTDTSISIASSPAFVRGDDVRAEPLKIKLVEPPARSRTSTLGVGAFFVALVAALLFAARKLRDLASVEQADAYLASEIDRAAIGKPSRNQR